MEPDHTCLRQFNRGYYFMDKKAAILPIGTGIGAMGGALIAPEDKGGAGFVHGGFRGAGWDLGGTGGLIAGSLYGLGKGNKKLYGRLGYGMGGLLGGGVAHRLAGKFPSEGPAKPKDKNVSEAFGELIEAIKRRYNYNDAILPILEDIARRNSAG